jgi:hypothetical protein
MDGKVSLKGILNVLQTIYKFWRSVMNENYILARATFYHDPDPLSVVVPDAGV